MTDNYVKGIINIVGIAKLLTTNKSPLKTTYLTSGGTLAAIVGNVAESTRLAKHSKTQLYLKVTKN